MTRRNTARRRKPTSFIARSAFVAGALLLIAGFVVPGVTMQLQASPVSQNAPALTMASQPRSAQLAANARIDHQQLHAQALQTITVAKQIVQANAGKVDTSPAGAAATALASFASLPDDAVKLRIDAANAAIGQVTAQAAVVDQQKAAAAVAAAAAAAAAQAQANADTPDGAKAAARAIAASQYGWGDAQFQCLSNLWQKESGWSYKAMNSGSGAAGIPQALPGSKMASIASDWATNAVTQIKWGLGYIAGSYGTPCSAWSHSQSMNWY